MRDLLDQGLGRLRYEPTEKRVRAKLATETVVDSTRALLVWEPRRVVPTYAVPVADIASDLRPAAQTGGDAAGLLHPGIPFAVHSAAGEAVSIGGLSGAGFRFADAALADYVALDFSAFDEWLEEDERIFGHPRDPFSRVDVRQTSRAVRIELDGERLAESTRARLLYETQVPTRFYLPREDVRVALEPSDLHTYCPYKGEASYWSSTVRGRQRENLAWSYPDPLPDAVAISGLVAFWDERVDVFIDGVPRPRPGGAVSAAMRDEFGV